MNDMLLGISPELLYFYRKIPRPISDFHSPYFLVFTSENIDIKIARNKLIDQWEKNKTDHQILSKIKSIGEIDTYRSFCDFTKNRQIFKVYTKESYVVPDVSHYLFFEHNLYTAEHDIPYRQRALTDLAAEGKVWLFDANGGQKKLKVLIYDIEMTNFEEGKRDLPIDIIGHSGFDILIESYKNIENEEFSFEILDLPSSWEGMEIKQLISRNVDEEIENFYKFCKVAESYDIISGHNIAGFDNAQLFGRINWILKNKNEKLSNNEKKTFSDFVNKYCRVDRSFHFGVSSEVVQIYPCTFDTYLAARKFYSFLDDFSLKGLAPFLGIGIKDRIFLTPSEIKIDARTLKYNRQDIQEQIGLTLLLIQQALPLAFTTCMPFDMLLPSGAVNIWDHMSLIRGGIQKKIMPPICRVKSISQILLRDFKGCNTKEEIVRAAKKKREQLSKDFIRILKYGPEMPEWIEYPYVIYNENAKDDEESLNYHMPGGMTIKPDKDTNSHFIPWYHVIVADVGAMYPTILKAMNIGADTVKLASSNEQPDAWIWLKKLPKQFFENIDVKWREITGEDAFADKGFMLGIKIDKSPGVVNLAMTGIMNIIAKIKQELKDAEVKGEKTELQRLKMMYQSMKGARNAGSVDYSQRIILQNPESNLVNIKIGEFVDNAIKEYGYRTERINGTYFEIADIKDNWAAFSVNKNGKVEIKRVRKAVRHKWSGKLVKITTKSGYTVVTPNHSVFTIRDKEIEEISAGNINYDTLLVHAEKIPAIEKRQTIDLIKEINKNGFYAFIDRHNIDFFNGIKDELISLNKKDNTSTPYLKIHLDKIRELDIPKELLKYITVGANGRKASRIPCSIPVDERLAELLGYFVSEGHISKKLVGENPQFYITFSSASEEMHDRIKEISEDILGVKVYTLDRMNDTGTIVSTVHAKVIARLFGDILNCGVKSKNKKIPSQILSAPLSVKNAFLKAYMEGDGNYKMEMPSSVPLGRYTTNSRYLNEDIITLQKQIGMKTNTYFRPGEKTYNTRMIGYFEGKKDSLGDCFAIPPKKIEFIDPSSDYVYDISVENNENFLDSNGGILLHNTHGILSAPTVTGRQFNLWGAAAITTKGQMILSDTIKYLKNREIRIVYGDTDGIYLGCSRSALNLPEFSKSLGLSPYQEADKWITKPNVAISTIEQCNIKWQKDLNYPDFELEPEKHDGMIFVKHKNYLIFDSKDGKIEMMTKGNNFKGSDKANIARKVLEKIMIDVLKENPSWDDEDDAREKIKNSIKSKTREILSKLDLTQVDLDDLTLVQSVQPAKRYKTNQDGSISTFGRRAEALERLIEQPIKTRIKLKFVVTKRPLPGIPKPSKSGVKPIDYMYPIDRLKNTSEIDLGWYKKMIENYVQGAFGISDVAVTEQTGLDAWM